MVVDEHQRALEIIRARALVGAGVLAFFGMFVTGAVLDLGELLLDGLRGRRLQLRVDGGVDFQAALVGLLVGEQAGKLVEHGLHGVVVLHAAGAVAGDLDLLVLGLLFLRAGDHVQLGHAREHGVALVGRAVGLASGEKRLGLRMSPAIMADSERSSCALGLPKYAWLAVSMP